MKHWIGLLLLFAGVMLSAEEAQDAYRALLLKNDDYAKLSALVQTQKADLDKLGESLYPGYAAIPKVPSKAPTADDPLVKAMLAVEKSPEFRQQAMIYSVNGMAMKIMEADLCSQMTDPAALAVLKDHFAQEQPMQFNAETAPKKDIPGSPAFQHAMFVVDKIKEEGAVKQKWPTMHALIWLMQNLKQVAFDDPDYRQKYYQSQAARLRMMKKEMELQQSHPELLDKMSQARAQMDLDKPETQKDFQQAMTELRKIIAADPEYQKLNEATSLASQAEMQALDAFAAKSDLPAAAEYRAFKAAITAPAK